jgi:regulator of PEP synthase PpsR (kinase-PPPase family)
MSQPVDGSTGGAIVFVMSDALGETAELVARAAASQFDGGRLVLRRFPFVQSADTVHDIVAEAAAAGAAIIYTLIRPGLRECMQAAAASAGVPAVDVMGPVLEAIARSSHGLPRLEPGLVHRLDEDYFRRVEAIEFAVRYDDGRDPRGLQRADVVLIGVSRSSKTPVSMYLANRQFKVANVPLVPEVEVPPELFAVPLKKVVGLTINPAQLRDIRLERLRAIGLPPEASYGELGRIEQELRYAQQVFARVGCPVIDVSNKAVEETATKVMELVAPGARTARGG